MSCTKCSNQRLKRHGPRDVRASGSNSENYEFSIIGTDLAAGRTAYVLEVRPKRSEKYLFEGRIWVDAEDYALVRAEGKPAKKPSFWTKSIHFVQIYQRCGPVWFPLSTQSVTEAHLFGTTDVSIEYFDYVPKTPNSSGQSCRVCQSRCQRHASAVTQCLILAAGNGSRIASVSRGVPKPLVPLCGVPLLEHVMTASREAGIERFVIVVGYRADLIRRWSEQLVRWTAFR